MTSTTTSSRPSTTTTTGVVVSAPGKMLLAGGYLVLDAPNAGLVVAVDKRFYAECRIITLNATEPPKATTATATIPIAVRSPQFGATWRYAWDPVRGTLVVRNEDAEPTAATKGAENSSNNTSNPFVEKALRVALLYLLGEELNFSIHKIRSLQITIAADNDFYSLVPHLRARGVARPTLQAAQQLPLRLPVARRKGEKGGPSSIYKTGLGSSACLVTAVTGSLVHAVRCLRSSTVEEENDDAAATQLVIARLAQIGHCHAQGKVGSGFDVSAACYGSHVYRRFSPALLEPLLVRLDDSSSDDSMEKNQATARLLRKLVDDDKAQAEWSGVQAGIRNFHGSKSFLQCMMADVSGGSESPSMAKAVLQWRRKQQQQSADGSSCPHWDDLATLNPQIVALLQQLETATANLDDDVLATLQQQLVDTRPDDWSSITATTSRSTAPSAAATVPVVAQLLAQLRTAFVQARRHLKAMGVAAGVPIEPDAQTALCDACRQVPGVVAALVPGAGGHDAVACVYINTAAVRQAVADLWADWKGQDGSDDQTVGALTVQGGDFGEGVRVEPAFPSLAVDDGTAPNESDA